MVLNGFARVGVDGKPERVRKAYGAKHPKMVFGEAAFGVADGADDLFLQIGFASDIVDDFVGDWIVEHSVNGEVAAFGILFGSAEMDAVGAAAILIARVFAEGGDFGFDAVLDDHDDPKGFADGDGFLKELFDLFGEGVGGDVVVFGGSAQQAVAHGSACKVGGESCGADFVQDVERVFHSIWR